MLLKVGLLIIMSKVRIADNVGKGKDRLQCWLLNVGIADKGF